MQNPVEAARSELSALQKQAEEIQSRIVEVETFLRMYAKYSGVSVGALNSTFEGFTGALAGYRTRLTSVPLQASKRERIAQAAKRILADGRPRSIRVLLDELKAMNVEIGGSDEAANLSAYLSREDAFVSDPKYGWTLKKEEPETAPTVSGSDVTQPAP